MSPTGLRRLFGAGERDTRLPPGQYDTGASFPVLTAEVSPKVDLSTWSLRIDGLVDTATTWTFDELRALPRSTYEGDIHCVTTWSKLGTSFTGIQRRRPVRADRRQARGHARRRLERHRLHDQPADRARPRRQGLDRLGARGQAAAAGARRPGPDDRAAPVLLEEREVVGGIRVLDHDEPGFWEVRGYHARRPVAGAEVRR